MHCRAAMTPNDLHRHQSRWPTPRISCGPKTSVINEKQNDVHLKSARTIEIETRLQWKQAMPSKQTPEPYAELKHGGLCLNVITLALTGQATPVFNLPRCQGWQPPDYSMRCIGYNEGRAATPCACKDGMLTINGISAQLYYAASHTD